MTFRRRTYPEVLDNVLTSLTGGVAAESHPFPPAGTGGAPPRHNLERPPASEIVSVYGSRGGEPFLFQPGANGDYSLVDDGRAVEWNEGGRQPDPGTLVEINYRPESGPPVVTDIRTGSVVRTLSESVALEIARLYAQLESVYDAGFVDTAAGSALDNVVALLGIERRPAGHAVGEIELRRSAGSAGAIFVPSGTRVTTADASIQYETTAAVTMADGQTAVRVAARDLELSEPLPADSLTLLPVPIAGIAAVTNPAPTRLANDRESDVELRERARNFLHGSERATPGALAEAIAREGVRAEVIETATPGRVEVVPQVESLSPEQRRRLERAIELTRPAGVEVVLAGVTPPRRVHLRLLLTTADNLLEQDVVAAHQAVRERLEGLLASRAADDALSLNRLAGDLLAVDAVRDMRLLEASWEIGSGAVEPLAAVDGELPVTGFPTRLGDLDLIDPGLPTRLETLIAAPADGPPIDTAAIDAALSTAVAYLNDLNQTPPAADLDPAAAAREIESRTLTFERLLSVLPLPGQVPTTLAELDNRPLEEALPALPRAADVAPLEVTFVIAQASGVTRQLTGGDSYGLGRSERLSPQGVALVETAGV